MASVPTRSSSVNPNGTPPTPADPEAILKALSAPFDPAEVKWKPAVVTGGRALALAYVDARSIQDRLDDVLGVANWQNEYEVLPDGCVMCRLRCRIGGEWLTKVDVGAPSEQPDEGDRRKAAFSDSLKRAAVMFGIGRYLYRLPAQWADYDTKKKQFVKKPGLPREALPAAAAQEPAPSAPVAAKAPAPAPEPAAPPKPAQGPHQAAPPAPQPPAQAAHQAAARAAIGHPPLEQLRRIELLVKELYVTEEQLGKRLHERYHVKLLSALSAEQADDLEQALVNARAERQRKAATPNN